MTHDAVTQLRRLLHLLPVMADGESHSYEEVARQAGTDVASILRDLRDVSERYSDSGAFVPGLSIFIEATRVTMSSIQFLRPMRLTAAELCALDLGLAMLRPESTPAEQEAIDRARGRLRKVCAGLPAGDEREVRAGDLGAAGDPAHLAVLRRGLRMHRTVRITYRGADAEASSERTIAPYGLVAAHGAWYVVAHCDDRDALRIFRLDRIEDARPLDEPFQVPRDFSLDRVAENGRVFASHEAEPLTVRYSPRVARWIAEREQRPLASDGSLTMEHPLADADWAVRHVLQYGPDAEVLAPPGVREAVARRLRAILAS